MQVKTDSYCYFMYTICLHLMKRWLRIRIRFVFIARYIKFSHSRNLSLYFISHHTDLSYTSNSLHKGSACEKIHISVERRNGEKIINPSLSNFKVTAIMILHY